MIAKLKAHPYAQAYVQTYASGDSKLISYTTEAAYIENGWLYITCLCSQTTRIHVGSYVKEYANIEYKTARQLYNDGKKYNIHTGEVCPI